MADSNTTAGRSDVELVSVATDAIIRANMALDRGHLRRAHGHLYDAIDALEVLGCLRPEHDDDV